MGGRNATLNFSGVSLAFWAVSLGIAKAAVVISSAATANMNCESGVCTPTAKKAVLNVGDLEALLSSGSATVTTTGSGVQTEDIQVSAPLTWANGSKLTFDAFRSITVDQSIHLAGEGDLSLETNDGGSGGRLSFGSKGNVQFADLSSALTINGTSFILVNSIASLASAIAANPDGAYALAADYDASADGTYKSTPISTEIDGGVEGLGNTITKLRLRFRQSGGYIALIDSVGPSGFVNDLRLTQEKVVVENTKKGHSDGAGLAEINYGTMSGDQVGGTFSTGDCAGCGVFGLVGVNWGTIDYSFADVQLSSPLYAAAGLVGTNAGEIGASHASGTIVGGWLVGGLAAGDTGTISGSYADATVSGGAGVVAGGLVGQFDGLIEDSYATGNVTGGNDSYAGGVVGEATSGVIQDSYSTGMVAGGESSSVGGFVGFDDTAQLSDCYWDTDTSGTDQGTGNGNKTGLTGLTSAQLASGLPKGFKKKTWAETATLNNGFPYLVALPPKK